MQRVTTSTPALVTSGDKQALQPQHDSHSNLWQYSLFRLVLLLSFFWNMLLFYFSDDQQLLQAVLHCPGDKQRPLQGVLGRSATKSARQWQLWSKP